jgi:hypothetical protein
MHDIGAGPHSDVDVFAGYRAVDDASYDDCGKSDAEGNLGDERACGAESGGGDEWAGVVVDDDGNEHVEGHCDALLEEECFLEVAWVFELGLEGEESDVTGWVC